MYNSNNPYKQKTRTQVHMNAPVNLLDLYDEGVARDKLRKIELRKDAIMLLRVKQKYDIISQHFAKFKTKQPYKVPYIKLNSGENLFMKSPEEMNKYKEIYKIVL